MRRGAEVDPRELARLTEAERLVAARPESDLVLREIVDELRGAFGVDLCMANMVLSDVQRFVAWSGDLPGELAEAGEGPREQSMCRLVVEAEVPLVVPDFLETQGFANQHFRVRYGVRFYAGVPLVTADGHTIGSLCLLNSLPVEFGDRDLALLMAFAKAAVGRLEALGALERERAAKRSERRILESITDAFFALDEEWRFVYLNAEAERVLFRKGEDLLGKNVWEKFPEAVGSTFEREYRRAVTERTAVEFEEYYPPLGTWFGVRAYPSEDGISVYFQDVSQRRRTEEALLESERRLRALLVRYSSEVVTILEGDGSIRYESPAVEGVLGYRPEELVGESVLDYVHPDDVERAAGELTAVDDLGPSHPVEVRFRHKDGSWRWLEGAGNDLRGDPDVRGIVVNSRDVTERKEAEEELKRSERALAEAQRIAAVGSWEVDVEGNTARWSDELYRIHGFEPQSFVPTGDAFLGMVHPDDRGRVEAFFGGFPGDGGRDAIECRIVRPDGEVRVVENHREAAFDGEGNLVRLAGTVQDVTERKEAEEKVREANRRLRELAALRADFAAMVAHEIANPLAAARGFLDVLATGELGPEERADFLAKAQDELGRLEVLVDDVRSAATVERDDFALSPRRVSVGELLEDAARFAETLPGGHPLVVDAGGAGNEAAWADPHRIGQVLRNLLSNAAKYSPDRAPMELRAVSGETSGRVRVEVADRGPGVHPDDHTRIFEKFGRGRGPGGRKAAGLGLGLYLSRRILRAHGSDLTVDAGPGGGSVFGFELEAAR